MSLPQLRQPGRYRVTVNFDTGTDERVVETSFVQNDLDITLQALADMRTKGPGVRGEVHDWRVEEFNHTENEKS